MAASAPLPPQNLDAEESVLGAMMLSQTALIAVRDFGLRSVEFYRETHGRIFNACLELHRNDEPVDAITVADKLQERNELEEIGGKQRVHDLAALVPATSNVLHYAAIVREKAQLRTLSSAGERIQRRVLAGDGDTSELIAWARSLIHDATDAPGGTVVELESWRQFEQQAGERVSCIVERLWPTSAFGFIAAPPKKGKTWVGLSLGISVASGKPFLGQYVIPTPRPVIYIALEGHRAAIRTRIGALARGMGLDPDSGDLDNLHFVYKPRGVNLADPAWTQRITDLAEKLGAALVVVDVLRAAAAIKENSNEEFNALRATLQPLTEHGCAIALLHHFGKLTEISRERTPGERMAGAGAMYGALDVGIFITGSDKEARALRLEFEVRDLATPDPIGVQLSGQGNGDNGGFVYGDAAVWEVAEDTPEEDKLRAPSAEDIRDWLTEHGEATMSDLCFALEMSDKTVRAREPRLHEIGVHVIRKKGLPTRYSVPVEPVAPPQQEAMLIDGINPTSEVHDPRPTSEVPRFRGESHNHADLPDTSEVRKFAATSVDLQGIQTSEPRNLYYVEANTAAADVATPGEVKPLPTSSDPDRDFQ